MAAMIRSGLGEVRDVHQHPAAVLCCLPDTVRVEVVPPTARWRTSECLILNDETAHVAAAAKQQPPTANKNTASRQRLAVIGRQGRGGAGCWLMRLA